MPRRRGAETRTAPSGAYPLRLLFPTRIMSGSMFQCCAAKVFQVRPMPVITSSAMRRIPFLRHISAMSRGVTLRRLSARLPKQKTGPRGTGCSAPVSGFRVGKWTDEGIVGANSWHWEKFFEGSDSRNTERCVPISAMSGCRARGRGDVSADGHRGESDAVIALAAGENAVAILGLAAFEVNCRASFSAVSVVFGAAGIE